MSEFNYLREKARMTRYTGRQNDCCDEHCRCSKCPLFITRNSRGLTCNALETRYPDKATEIVRKWAEEHPRKTRKDVLLEKFPNAKLDSNGHPHVCAQNLGITEKCPPGNSCAVCWDAEVEE